MSRLVRSSGLPRDVYRPEISTKSALFPRFRHREIEAYHRVLIVVRPRKGGVGTHDAIAERLSRRSKNDRRLCRGRDMRDRGARGRPLLESELSRADERPAQRSEKEPDPGARCPHRGRGLIVRRLAPRVDLYPAVRPVESMVRTGTRKRGKPSATN